jgi:thymidine kinase
MFDENINLIRGYSYSGKTTFLIDLANSLVDSGFKICFISTGDENRYHRNKFTFYRSLSNRFEEDYKMIQLVSEIIIRDNYDYLFIDDIDCFYDQNFFAQKETDKILQILIDTPVKKILTCEYEEASYLPTISMTSVNFFKSNSTYYLKKEYNEDKYSNDSLIKKERSGTLESTTDVIKKTIRDIKIEKILK